MRPIELAWAADAAGGILAAGDPGAKATGAAVDSRAVRPGDLFFALKGDRTDGHLYVGDAACRGAVGAVVDRVPEAELPPGFGIILADDVVGALGRLASMSIRRMPDLLRIGVTGSVGKTTTKEMIGCALSSSLRTFVSEANFNTEIGVPLSALRVRDEHEAAVFELAMRGPGQIRYLCEVIGPRVGVITNIGPTHMELLGSQERIALAKAELLECLPRDGIAVLNMDDPWCMKVASRFAGAGRFFFSLRPPERPPLGGSDCLVFGESIELSRKGASFRFSAAGGMRAGPIEVRLRALGAHNVSNALAAAAAGLAAGIDAAAMAEGLSGFRPGPMRLEVQSAQFGITLIDDSYNASPMSMKAALDVLSSFSNRRKVAVLGDMLELGPEEQAGHLEVGRAVARSGVGILVLVGERARAIGEAAREAEDGPGSIVFCRDAREASEALRKRLRPGDVVLVKGSRAMGMERISEEMRESTP